MGAVRIRDFGIKPVSSVAQCYRCTWSDSLWRFRWDNDGKMQRSKVAFPDDLGWSTFREAKTAAMGLGFRDEMVIQVYA